MQTYGQFRCKKRKEVIILLDKDSTSTMPSELTKIITGDVDKASFHYVNGKNFSRDHDIVHYIFR